MMFRIKNILPLLLIFAGAALAGAENLDTLFDGKKSMWELKIQDFAKMFPKAFVPVDQEGTQIRYNINLKPETEIEYLDFEVAEILAFFTEDKLSSLDVYLYNVGDSPKKLNKKQYNDAIAKCNKLLAEKNPASPPKRLNRNLGKSSVIAQVYHTDKVDYMLRYSSGSDRGEYIVLSCYPPGKAPEDLSSSLAVGKSDKDDLTSRIERKENGDVFISVPMVDQGEKGYCVPATVSRIINYYGKRVDQHVIAQLMGTDAKDGTNMDIAMKALKRASGKLNLRAQELIDGEAFTEVKGFKRMAKEYNKVVKDMNRKIKDRESRKKEINPDINGKLPVLDPEILIASRGTEKKAVASFTKEVMRSIDRGEVLCWAVIVFPPGKDGKVQPGAPAGHYRIINGYNAKKQEIIFTDSYGLGHESSRCSFAEAWAITVKVFSITPKN